jgi:putative transposase
VGHPLYFGVAHRLIMLPVSHPLRNAGDSPFQLYNICCIFLQTAAMPIPAQYKAPFEFTSHYHLLFRSIDGIPLFKSINEKQFFLEKWKRFTDFIFETWAYCLLENHVHIIVKIKSAEEIELGLTKLPNESKTKSINQFLETKTAELFETVAERQLNSFMVSYANTYNNIIERKGGVFQQPFRRSLIFEDAHLQQAIVYVHANAQKHGLIKDFQEHNYNSYHDIIDGNESIVNAEAVLTFFGGIEKFISIHNEQVAYFYKHQWPDSKLEIE